MRRFLVIPFAAAALVLGAVGASAASFTITPWAYSCGHTTTANTLATRTDTPDSNGCPANDVPGTATAQYADGVLTLSKLCSEVDAATCTKDDLSAGATVSGLAHISAFSFDVAGYCGAGAPRLNVMTSDDKIHFFGCAANNHDGHVVIDFSAAGDGAGNGGVKATETIKSVNFVQDEAGSATIRNIAITGTAATSPTPPPTTSAPATTPHATTTTPRLAQTGSGLSLVSVALGGGLVLLGVVVIGLRRRRVA